MATKMVTAMDVTHYIWLWLSNFKEFPFWKRVRQSLSENPKLRFGFRWVLLLFLGAARVPAHWCGLTLIPVHSFGCHNIRKMLRCWRAAKGGTKGWWRALRGMWVVAEVTWFVQCGDDWGKTSLRLLPHKGRRRTKHWQNPRKWHEALSGEVQVGY